jgi:peptidoglycan/LPS O-acetylase OafA/YrhL
MTKPIDVSDLSPVNTVHSAGWRRDIQGLRGLAILLVVLYHAKLPIPGGFVGVDVFFVISGYVITASVMRRIVAGRFSAREFYWRRFRRLIPALSVVVSVVLIISFAFQSPISNQSNTGWMAVGAMLSISNVVAYFSPEGYFYQGLSPNPLLNTWSLSVEEQFYFGFTIVVIAVIFLAKRYGALNSKKILIGVFLTGIFGSFVISVASSFRTPGTLLYVPDFINPDFAFYSPITRAWEFGLGSLLAITGWVICGRRLASIVSALGIAMILIAAFSISEETVFPGLVVAVPVLGTLLIILARNEQDGTLFSPLNSEVFTRLGSVSYSWYLWHWPIIIFAVAALGASLWVSLTAAFVSLIPSWFSLKYIETPNLRIEWKSLKIKSAPFVKWFAPPLILGFLLILLSTNLWFNQPLKNMAQQTDAALLEVDCTDVIADFGIGSLVCTWPSDAEGVPVYLVGDSTAAQYANAIHERLTASGRSLTVAVHPGCPFLGTKPYNNKGSLFADDLECQKANLEFRKILSNSTPGLVVLTSSSVPFYASNRAVGVGNQLPSREMARKAVDLEIGLGDLIDSLQFEGHSVAVIQSTPEFFVREGDYSPLDQWGPSNCSGLSLLDVDENCGTFRSIGQLDAYQGMSRAAIAAASQTRSVRLLDPRSTLCLNGDCPTNRGNLWMFRDGVHLSETGVELMGPELDTLLN